MSTTTLRSPLATVAHPRGTAVPRGSSLLRRHLGTALRRRREDQQRTLRDVAAAAGVSLGYLSEVERGIKEASSELLSSICSALEAPLADVLLEVVDALYDSDSTSSAGSPRSSARAA